MENCWLMDRQFHQVVNSGKTFHRNFHTMATSTILTIVLILIIIRPCTSQTRANVQMLSSAVLTNYDKDIRPNDNQSQPTNITFSLEIYSIVETDEKTGLLAVALGIKNKWHDPRVSWTPASYGGLTDLKMLISKMWTPTYAFGPPVVHFKSFGSNKQTIEYSYQGDAGMFTADLVQVKCDYNVQYFPFDTQKCTLFCIPLGYTSKDINFIIPNYPVDLSAYFENGEWEIQNITFGILDSINWTSVTITFILHRRWQFFILIDLSPILFLLLLNSMVFVLPPESGERIGYAITCVLSLAVFLTAVTDTLPSTSKNMSDMSVFLILMLGFSTIFCIATIISLIAYHKDETKPIPKWIKTLTFKIKRFRCCRKCSISNNNVSKVVPIKTIANKSKDTKNVTKQDNECQSIINDRKEDNVTIDDIEWKDVGQVVDRIFFVASLLLTNICTMAFLLRVSLTEQ